ncbi:Cap-Gly domain protein [Ranid herpesvirus 3]|uniref:Cap-Gly domain protein n=1 Tax=Ranid herpesvirus 3 TaxID=1987509 RepID=A0A1X9T519_9VIRU|nr:Cap-Gly domain protein [Ranid herpesvirus 3]ARR28809.1 Cap-Gly domain protein [Ranid herpesvirus 3]
MYHVLLSDFVQPRQTAIKVRRPSIVTAMAGTPAFGRYLPMTPDQALKTLSAFLPCKNHQDLLSATLNPLYELGQPKFHPMGVYTSELENQRMVFCASTGHYVELTTMGQEGSLHVRLAACNLEDYLNGSTEQPWHPITDTTHSTIPVSKNGKPAIESFINRNLALEPHARVTNPPPEYVSINTLAYKNINHFNGVRTKHDTLQVVSFCQDFQGAFFQVFLQDPNFTTFLHILSESSLRQVIMDFAPEMNVNLSFFSNLFQDHVTFVGVLSFRGQNNFGMRFLAMTAGGQFFTCDPNVGMWMKSVDSVAKLKTHHLGDMYRDEEFSKIYPSGYCMNPVTDNSVNVMVECAILQSMCPSFMRGGWRFRGPRSNSNVFNIHKNTIIGVLPKLLAPPPLKTAVNHFSFDFVPRNYVKVCDDSKNNMFHQLSKEKLVEKLKCALGEAHRELFLIVKEHMSPLDTLDPMVKIGPVEPIFNNYVEPEKYNHHTSGESQSSVATPTPSHVRPSTSTQALKRSHDNRESRNTTNSKRFSP